MSFDPSGDPPALIACAHGTSSPTGAASVAALVSAVRDRLAPTPVLDAFVDVQSPTPSQALHDHPSAVIVPLLLSPGYHVHVDLAEAAETRPGTIVTAAMGPSSAVTEVLVQRLAELDPPLGTDDVLVLAAAGSSDDRAVAATAAQAQELARALALPDDAVHVGYARASQPALPALLTELRTRYAGQRIVLSAYLLAEGHFLDYLHGLDADVVAAPLLRPECQPPTPLVELIVQHYRDASAHRV